METEAFGVLAKVLPIIGLVILGVLGFYSVVGVPAGLVFLGLAIGLAVYQIRKHHDGLPHH